jgi:hypothetical protein
MYIDPDGEFVVTAIMAVANFLWNTFVRVWTQGVKAWSSASNWTPTVIAAKIDAGAFVTDPNKNAWGQIGEFVSRWTWESLQSLIGNLYSHARNIGGAVDRVDYLGGATFVTNENSENENGVTFGSYIDINIYDRINTDFEDYVTTVNPMYMHEYGHTIDSRYFGISYLFAIGIPSLVSVSKSSQIDSETRGVYTHNFYWTEMRANKNAKKYFEKYYGVDWNTPYHIWGYLDLGTTIETFYPTIKR